MNSQVKASSNQAYAKFCKEDTMEEENNENECIGCGQDDKICTCDEGIRRRGIPA